MLKHKKVLIVEDEPTLAENIMAQVQRCGGEACIALTGKQALAGLDAFPPDIVLLDYHLPDMDGFEILDRIRQRHFDCPCVLMTGHPFEEIMPRAQRTDITHILSKPFALSEMTACLADAIEKKKRPFVPALPAVHDRRQHDRRTQTCQIFIAVQLPDGTLLRHDRRTQARRR